MNAVTLTPGQVVQLDSGQAYLVQSIDDHNSHVTMKTLLLNDRVSIIRSRVPACWFDEHELVFPADRAPAIGDTIATGDQLFLVTDQRSDGGIVHCLLAETSSTTSKRKRQR